VKDQNYHYIVQLESGMYWAGYNTFTDQIRKARMYNSLKRAHTDALDSIRRNRKTLTSTRYRVLKVEINILEIEEYQDI
jgi:hypothetical protein